MSNIQIDHSKDLKKLRDEGYNVRTKENYLIVEDIPYIDEKATIKKDGILVTNLEIVQSPNMPTVTSSPIKQHVIYFKGSYPCNKTGKPIEGIRHQTVNRSVGSILCNYSFSNKPSTGYKDYYEKIVRYIEIISAPAISKDNTLTAKVFRAIPNENKSDSVFKFIDTNSSISGVNDINNRCRGMKVALIGLGGTGSYVLDHLVRMEVSEIHLYDGDVFLQQNAFRAPGSIFLEDFHLKPFKTDFYKEKYSGFREGIVSVPEYITENNCNELLNFDFVFLNMDSDEIKKKIISLLVENKVKFIETGVGLDFSPNNKISGIGRVIYSDENNNMHLEKRISYVSDEEKLYGSNIQTSDINNLLACIAVVKFKKSIGIYEDDLEDSYNTFNLDLDGGGLICENNRI